MKQFRTIEPLSNFDLIELCKELKNFKGCFMRDELSNLQRTADESFVINLDSSRGSGTHWTCTFIKNGQGFYFDPFGMKPTTELEKYLKGVPYCYSSFQIQSAEEVICGHYCVFMLQQLNSGMNFYDVLLKLI